MKMLLCGVPPILPDIVGRVALHGDSSPLAKVRRKRQLELLHNILHTRISLEMKNRPISLTIIAWLSIVMSLLSVLNALHALNDSASMEILSSGITRLPARATIAIGIVVNAVYFVLGIAILKRRAWARTAYVVLLVLGIVASLINWQPGMYVMVVPGILLAALIGYVLYRRPATEYFHGPSA
ncbi:hypothetical protein [Paraburkholderia dinghuensis]|uniref:Uncharacterized protein n=1 Tax=Paraburkholderia dinghuensis TaxID=2305225 RepID=A0A3N6Q3R6_9BURK|nr:hypothetical protein [Paraburkholderia dinghuensis]RQH09780.1 hypothetical protein D1Y85_01110 [Paraburkholderia dinghuensis]